MLRHRRLGHLAWAAALAACRSTALSEGPPPGATHAPAAPASASVAADASVDADAPRVIGAQAADDDAPLAWGTRPPKDGVLFPIVDGMCIHGSVAALENGVVFSYGTSRGAYSRGGATTTALLGDRGLEPQDGLGFGAAFGFWAVTAFGGHYPERLWAIVDVSSRMVQASEVRLGSAASRDWKTLIDSGAKFGDAGNAATPGAPLRNHGAPLVLEDGSLLVPEEAIVRQSTGDASTFSFRVVGANGALVVGAKAPGADLARLAMAGRGVVRLANGEVLGLRGEPTPKLVRWSPAKPVDDLSVSGAKGDGTLVAGRTRAFFQLGEQLFVYDGDTVTAAKLSSRLVKGFTWAVSVDDTLLVALPNKTLLTEPARGPVTEEPMPAFGKLTAAGSGDVWLQAEGQLHRRRAGKWQPVAIPSPPFGNALRGPLKVESIQSFGADDVIVNARRFEKGWGWKDPEPYRVLYRTKRPAQVLRCQDVRNEGTGTGLYAWPPAADDACTTPFVVVMREEVKTLPKDYPSIAARLRGKTEYGDALTFVNFDGRGSKNLGIVMSDVARARTLATYLSKSLDLRADVVCGRPPPTRELSYDVVKGTFAPAPAK